MPGRTLFFRYLALVVLLCVAVFASLLLGRESLVWGDLLRAWQRGENAGTYPALNILLMQRLPRTAAALFAGGGLAVIGAVFQVLLRNPLATPYTLGVSNAAALGAWGTLLLTDALMPSLQDHLPYLDKVAAFILAGTHVLLLLILVLHRRFAPELLLLSGVTLGMLCNAGIMFTRYLARPDRLVNMDRWMMGGVDVIGYRPVWLLACGVIPAFFTAMVYARSLDQFAFDPDVAAGRGVSVRAMYAWLFAVASLAVAVIVSEVGPIGFVGLVVPHVMRAWLGSRHTALFIGCILGGGLFLLACDIAGRLLMPGEVPIGIITTLLGAPYFLYLLLSRGHRVWGETRRAGG
jgi:iron complex transport system permease protein